MERAVSRCLLYFLQVIYKILLDYIKGRHQDNFGRAVLTVDQTGGDVTPAKKSFCLDIYFC